MRANDFDDEAATATGSDRAPTSEAARTPDVRRRAVLVGVGSALTVGLAGCSGDGGDPTETADTGGPAGTDAPDESTTDAGPAPADTATDAASPTPTATSAPPTPVQEEMGQVVQDVIGELRIVAWESEASGDIFGVRIAVQNQGEQATDIEAYTWAVAIYDEDGNEIVPGAAGPAIAEGPQTVEPGQGTTVYYETRPDDASAVASYEIYLSCDGRSADGVYCPE